MTNPQAGLMQSTTISTICGHRDAALAQMAEAAKTIELGYQLASKAEDLASKAHMSVPFCHPDRTQSDTFQSLFSKFKAEPSLAVYREQLDARVWTHLLDATGMNTLMDRQEKETMKKDLLADVPQVTEENAWGLLNRLSGDAELIFQRGLARAFIKLDRRFRSHDGFKLGTRVVLTNVFDTWGGVSYHSNMEDTMTDIERVFAVLDGVQPDGAGLIQTIREDRKGGFNPKQSVTETPYFKVKGYKNGNAHLWFTRDDLVEKANLMLADYYGEVLPDAVPKAGTSEDLKSKGGALAKDLSFYPTPASVTERMIKDIYIQKGDKILEPSAGTGHMVKTLLQKTKAGHITAYEVDPDRAHMLKALDGDRVTSAKANFLNATPSPTYDHVIMNPPFAGTHWMEHIVHAFDFLAPGGTLSAVLPVSAEMGTTKKHETFRKWAKSHNNTFNGLFRDLPAESFAESGTKINTVVLTLHANK